MVLVSLLSRVLSSVSLVKWVSRVTFRGFSKIYIYITYGSIVVLAYAVRSATGMIYSSLCGPLSWVWFRTFVALSKWVPPSSVYLLEDHGPYVVVAPAITEAIPTIEAATKALRALWSSVMIRTLVRLTLKLREEALSCMKWVSWLFKTSDEDGFFYSLVLVHVVQ